ncbi:unnamed protein product [Choristocarpus tenellus]
MRKKTVRGEGQSISSPSNGKNGRGNGHDHPNIHPVSFPLTEHQKTELAQIAQSLAARGKGILAADESTPTIGKRLVGAGLVNDLETRRQYREVLLSHPSLGEWLGGVILFEETLYQTTSNGKRFVNVLQDKGILVGVKTDKGLQKIAGSLRETTTRGMDTLLERNREYYSQGARFAKWRATIRIDDKANLPTMGAIKANAAELARYAVLSQVAGLVPIVEPEILIDGDHSIERFAEVSELVLGEVYGALSAAGVFLEGTLLKPQMMMAGVDAPDKKATPERTAELTLQTLRRRVPPAVPGVVFLSGGQSEEEATRNLNLINRRADGDPGKRHPWSLSFSFGRSLQASVLKVWAGKTCNFAAAVEMAGKLAQVNSAAQLGLFEGSHPSIVGGNTLHDPHRGWRTDVEETAV